MDAYKHPMESSIAAINSKLVNLNSLVGKTIGEYVVKDFRYSPSCRELILHLLQHGCVPASWHGKIAPSVVHNRELLEETLKQQLSA